MHFALLVLSVTFKHFFVAIIANYPHHSYIYLLFVANEIITRYHLRKKKTKMKLQRRHK